jgi:hypothetical protein
LVQGYDLQAAIARYREELLQTAARSRTSAPEVLPDPSPIQPDPPLAPEEGEAEMGKEAPEGTAEQQILGEEPPIEESPIPEVSEEPAEEPKMEWAAPSCGPQDPHGRIQVRAVTANGLRPVEGAFVAISLLEKEKETLLQTLSTGADGCTPDCKAPLLPQGENADGGTERCTYYHVRVEKPGYFVCHAYRVPVYEGRVSHPCARLIPFPGSGQRPRAERPGRFTAENKTQSSAQKKENSPGKC